MLKNLGENPNINALQNSNILLNLEMTFEKMNAGLNAIP